MTYLKKIIKNNSFINYLNKKKSVKKFIKCLIKEEKNFSMPEAPILPLNNPKPQELTFFLLFFPFPIGPPEPLYDNGTINFSSPVKGGGDGFVTSGGFETGHLNPYLSRGSQEVLGEGVKNVQAVNHVSLTDGYAERDQLAEVG